jgi:hypothetical protein
MIAPFTQKCMMHETLGVPVPVREASVIIACQPCTDYGCLLLLLLCDHFARGTWSRPAPFVPASAGVRATNHGVKGGIPASAATTEAQRDAGAAFDVHTLSCMLMLGLATSAHQTVPCPLSGSQQHG